MKLLIAVALLAATMQAQTVEIYRDRKPCSLTLQLFPFLGEEAEDVKPPWRPLPDYKLLTYKVAYL